MTSLVPVFLKNSVEASEFRRKFRFQGIDSCNRFTLQTHAEPRSGVILHRGVFSLFLKLPGRAMAAYLLFPADGSDCR